MRAILACFAATAVAMTATAASANCAWRRGELLTLQGAVRSGGLDGRVLRRIELGRGRLLERTDLGVVRSARGYDGRTAWSQDVSGATHDLDSDFARRLAISEAWLDARQACLPSQGLGERLADAREGARTFRVWRVTPAGGAPFEVWVDGTSGRLDRAVFQTTETRLIRHFADWRDLGGGREVAFLQRDEFPEDEDEVVYRFETARIGANASGRAFRRPAAPRDVRMHGGRSATSVPYEDDHRSRIYVPVYLNGRGPFTFELDNGGHFIVSQETAKAAGLVAEGAFSNTGAGAEVNHSGFGRVRNVRIGQAEMLDQPARVLPLSASSNDRGPHPPRAGILGLELFERFVVGIDRRNHTVRLSPIGAAYPKPRGQPVRLKFAEDAPLIAGSFDGHAGDFMLDTGNAGATIIEHAWAAPAGLTGRLGQGLRLGPAVLSRGEVGLGPFRRTNETVSYYGPVERGSENSRAVAGVYGEPLLSRFNAVYDYGRKTVWLEPLADAPALAPNRAGLAVGRNGGEGLKVTAVAEGSPAAEAGLKTGDLLASVGGVPARALGRADAAALFRQPAGTVIELGVASAGAERSVTLRLRDLY